VVPQPGAIRSQAWLDRFDAVYRAADTARPDLLAAFVVETVALTGRYRDGKATPAALHRACQFLQQHSDGPVTLGRLATMAGLSPFRLHHLFRQRTGLPPHAFLVQLRLRRARSLLEDGEPIAAAAAAAGFVDQSHLSRLFKRFMGVPPGLYRRQMLRP
jgi:AraC-like DNA-binding protein